MNIEEDEMHTSHWEFGINIVSGLLILGANTIVLLVSYPTLNDTA